MIERDDKTVTVTAQPGEGEPVGRTADLSLVVSRGAMPVTVRLTGTPSRPEGSDPDRGRSFAGRLLPLPYAE